MLAYACMGFRDTGGAFLRIALPSGYLLLLCFNSQGRIFHSMNSGLDADAPVPLSPSIASERAAVPASAPFDDPRSDIILRTSDHVEFRVLKIILGLASPVFSDMFSLPQPAFKDESSAEIPIIPISESSATLDAVLRICYPIETPDLDNLDVSLIGGILTAALKYDINAVIGLARKDLRTRAEATETDAIAAYAIACHFKLEREVRMAAVASLKWPLFGSEVPQLILINGLDYYKLVRFHKSSSDAVAALFQSPSFSMETCSQILAFWHGCRCGYTHKHQEVVSWWTFSLSNLCEAAKIAPVDTSKLTLPTILSALETSKCSSCEACRKKLLCGWKQTKRSIIEAMEAEIGRIKLKLSWM